jgi:DNA-binding transcriptional MerR regulator
MDRKIDVDDVAISVGSAAASVGLTPATLRTWDRRYGLSPSMRTEGGHRRYGHADLLRLRLAARFIQTGLPPAGAVAAVAGWSDDECRKREGAYGQSLMFWRARGPLTDSGAKQSENDSEPNEPERTRAGGGRTVPMPDATEKQRGMARAAMSLDGDRVREMMSTAIADSGTIAAWNDLAAPTLIALGEKWAQTGENIEVEHVATLALEDALEQSRVKQASLPLALGLADADRGSRVILACAPKDRHVLGMLALRAALLEHGTNAVMLGAELPLSSLAAAVGRLRPRAIVIWASMPEHADVAGLSALPHHRPSAKMFIAGPGWAGVEVPPEFARSLESIEDAVERLAL